jgi:hypothetical protein
VSDIALEERFYQAFGAAVRAGDEPGMAQQWRGPGSWRPPD